MLTADGCQRFSGLSGSAGTAFSDQNGFGHKLLRRNRSGKVGGRRLGLRRHDDDRMAQPPAMDERDVVEVAHRLRQRAAAVEAHLDHVVVLGLVIVHADGVGDIVAEPARSGPPTRWTRREGVAAREPAGAGFADSGLHRDVLV